MTILEIIQRCGGTSAIAEASKRYTKPITYRGVLKWKVNGIPPRWFSIVCELSGVSLEEIHKANLKTDRYEEFMHEEETAA